MVQPGLPSSLEGPSSGWLQADNQGAKRQLLHSNQPVSLYIKDAHGNVVAPPPGTTATATLQLLPANRDDAAAAAAVPLLDADPHRPVLEGTAGSIQGSSIVFGDLAIVEGSGQGYVQPAGGSYDLAVRFQVALPGGMQHQVDVTLYFVDMVSADVLKQEAQAR